MSEALSAAGLNAPDEYVSAAGLNHRAELQDRNPVGDQQNDRKMMGNEEKRRVLVLAELDQDLEKRCGNLDMEH